MAFAVDIKDRHGPNRKMRHQLLLKKTKVMFY